MSLATLCPICFNDKEIICPMNCKTLSKLARQDQPGPD